ncbi:MAG TPA: CHAT domain-containing tetratricopeptide repeat protein [Leadbetterella sp.]|nr:CHAT domain-containing tetratricopeptide repeat protein [Leadbetterella sp.]
MASFDVALGLKYYQKAAELAHREKQFVWEANILADQGGAFHDLGQYDDGIKACNLGLQLLRDQKERNDSVQFKLYSSLAPSYRKLYKSVLAIQACEKALQILNTNSKVLKQTPLFVTYFYRNYGRLMQDLFDTEKARIYYQKALETSKVLPNPIHYARVLGNLCNLSAFTSEYEKGIELYQQLIALLNSQNRPDIPELTKSHYMLGYFYSKIHNHKMAIVHYKKAIILGRDLKDSFDYPGMATIDMSESYVKMGEVELAKKNLNSLARSSENLEYEYYLNLAWANLYKSLRNFNSSKKYFLEAFKVYFPLENPESIRPEKISLERLKLFEVLNLLGNLYNEEFRTSGDKITLKKAYLMKSKCLEVGRQIRQYQYNLDSRLFFTDKYHTVFKDLLNIGLELNSISPQGEGFVESLFKTAEEAKSVMVNDPLRLKNNQRDPVADSLILKLQSYQSYLSYLKSSNGKQSVILEYEHSVNEIRDKITRRNSAITKGKIETKFEFGVLPEDMLYLNYFLYNNHLMVFSKSKKSLIIRKVQIDKTKFLSSIDFLRKSLTNPPSPFEGFLGDTAAGVLHRILLEQAIPEYKNYRRLIVNPDNTFFDISFDVLRNTKTGFYLIESHSISYAPSIDHAMRKNSVFKWFRRDWVALFPFADISKKLISGLRPLRFSLNDVKGIRTQNFRDSSATKALFLKSLEEVNYQAVLVSTHASGNSADPYLIFSSGNDPNSRLFASELRHYQIQTPMVVLSACDTHKGKTYEGLGAMSFATSLAWAGCPSVAATFWEVDDQSMSVLTSLFYKYLQKGLPKDLALQKAKIEFLHTETGKVNDNPFYWSHFQVIGSVEPVISTTELLLPYLLAAAVLIAVFVIFKKRIILFFKP